MGESPPLLFALGLGLIVIARPILMGCFSSKEEPIATQKPYTQQNVQSVPAPKSQQFQQHQTPHQVPQHQPEHLQSTSVPQNQDVVSLPRPVVTYGEREKNELKVKNLRDKLETTIITSEQVLKDEAIIAVRMHKEGNKAHARVLLQRRRHTHRKIDNCQTMLATVMEMIQTMDMATDNAKFVHAVESGTKAVKDVMDGMSVERVHMALDDAKQAEAYTNEIGNALNADEDILDDDEFESQVAEMTQRYIVPEEVEEVRPDMHVEETHENGQMPEVNAEMVNGDMNVTERMDRISSPTVAENAEGDEVSSLTDRLDTTIEKIAAIPKLPTELPPQPVALEPVEGEDVEPAAIAM